MQPAEQERLLVFWQHQVLAEYASASMTAHFTHWLIQLGAPLELIRQALTIAQDEVTHAEVCHQVAVSLGSDQPLDTASAQMSFAAPFTDPRKNCCAALLNFYCLGETAAVPLFAAMRKDTTERLPLRAYERIIEDEPRHATFGWLALAWVDEVWSEARAWLQELFPLALERMAEQYYCESEYQPILSTTEREWGMLPRLTYTHLFESKIIPLYAKQLQYYDIDVVAQWQQLKKRRFA